jgi:hypothetical protein
MKNKQNNNTHSNYSANTNQNLNSPTKQKANTKIVNWQEYNQSLENRGNFTILLDTALLYNQVAQTGRAGHPYEYSNSLILFLAQLRELTQLPLRQTIGAAKAVFTQADLTIPLPKYNTLSRRMRGLQIPTHLDKISFTSPIILLPDSTGLKISGEGEWKVRKHGKDKRRTWVKVHLGVDYNTGACVATDITDADTHDARSFNTLLQQAETVHEVEMISADGAYSGRPTREIATEHKVRLVSPPPKNAAYHGSLNQYGEIIDDPGWETWNESVRGVIRLGRAEWKRQMGYHKRSLAETAMSRLKRSFGGCLKSKTKRNQIAEVTLRVSLLNLFTSYGRPLYST